MSVLQYLLYWSEVWALLIPLSVIAFKKPKEKHIRILVWYVIIAFILNLTANLMANFFYLAPKWMYLDGMVNNNILYNIHSIIRVLLFGLYIITIRPYRYSILPKTILAAYLLFILINFIYFASPFYLSTNLFAAESIVLLILSFNYYISSIQDESQTNWLKHPSFLICAGVSLYEVITFFIFLFFYPLIQKDQAFFVVTMQIYAISFLMLCLLLALAFYQSKKQSQRDSVSG